MSALLALLAACASPAEKVTYAADTAGGDAAGECQESNRRAVDDPTAPADGFDFAVDDLLGVTMGSFAGLVDYPSGSVSTALSLSLGSGEIEAVYFGGAGELCEPRYEVVGAGTLIAGDLYAQLLDVRISATTLDDAAFSTTFPGDAVNGTAAPQRLAAGADLSLAATLTEGGWGGSLDWVSPAGEAEPYARFTLARVAE